MQLNISNKMKVCVIGFARSRSSIVLETISLFYNIPILGEDLNQITKDLKSPPSTPAYREFLKKHLEVDEGVIRFHPFQLHEMPKSEMQSKFELFNFGQYDKIYITYRDSVADIIASNFVARKLKKYTYKSKDEVIKNIEPMTIENHSVIVDQIHFEGIVDRLKDYFKDNNIDYIELYYNTIPEYLAKNFPGVSSFHVETEYDYKSIITNYNEIEPLYEFYKKQILENQQINIGKGE